MDSDMDSDKHLSDKAYYMADDEKALFGGAASFLIRFTDSCFDRISYLPFPVGFVVKTVRPWIHPLVDAAERTTLEFLSVVDNQIYTVGTYVEGWILCSAESLLSVLSMLRRRGLIGSLADLWVTYEATLRENVQKVIDVANRIPLLNLIMPLVCTVSAPLARAVSDWLVKQSQMQDKRVYLPSKDEEDYDQLEVKRVHAAEEGIAKSNGFKAAVDSSTLSQQEQEAKPQPIKEQEQEVKPEPTKEGIEEEPGGEREEETKQEDVMSDVLEMIDSGWIMGSAAISPRAAPASPRVLFPSPRGGSPSSKYRRNILSAE